MKRSFEIDNSPCIDNKKHRVITVLENLSNEVFYEIFEYLDGFDMLTAFSNLNHRFQTLINHSSIPFKSIDDHSESMSIENYSKEIIRPNQSRLLSLYLNLISEWNDNCWFDYLYFDASFTRLECLIMGRIFTTQLLTICTQLKSLPRLYMLKVNAIEQQELSPMFDMVYYAVFSLPVLKSFSITTRDDWSIENLAIVPPETTNVDQKPSLIKDLTIKHSVSGKNLLSLLAYLPEIRHLKCQILKTFDKIDPQLNMINFPHLKQISIEMCSLRFYQLERLMKTIGQTVEILQIEWCHMNGYLSAAKWEKLIENYLPRLKIFDMKYQRYRRCQINLRSDLIIGFTSQFWTEHGWFTSVRYHDSSMKFHIHPYKKQWFDRHRDTKQFDSRFVELSICSRFFYENNSYLVEVKKQKLFEIPFTHLCFRFQRCLTFLFKMAADLLHVDSLVLGSIDDNDASEDIEEDRLTFVRTNRITKVKIGSITKSEEIQSILNLFPHMKYFELNIISHRLDLVTALRCILTNSSSKVPNVRSICFDQVNIDLNLVNQLRQMIDDEFHIQNYSLKSVKNQIFFQWNRSDFLNV